MFIENRSLILSHVMYIMLEYGHFCEKFSNLSEYEDVYCNNLSIHLIASQTPHQSTTNRA